MPVKSLLFAAAILALFAAEAQGGEKFSAEDMVKYFTSGAGNGATRGLCVGEGCEPAGASKPDMGFDLNVTFELDSAQLTDQAQAQLSVAAEAMNSNELGAMKFAVEGYTDASGSDDHNLDLSKRRAKSVLQYLNDKGVDVSRLVANGYGESRLITNDPMDPLNRRVETRRIVE